MLFYKYIFTDKTINMIQRSIIFDTILNKIQAYNYSFCHDPVFYELVTYMHTSRYLELVRASCLNCKQTCQLWGYLLGAHF